MVIHPNKGSIITNHCIFSSYIHTTFYISDTVLINNSTRLDNYSSTQTHTHYSIEVPVNTSLQSKDTATKMGCHILSIVVHSLQTNHLLLNTDILYSEVPYIFIELYYEVPTSLLFAFYIMLRYH